MNIAQFKKILPVLRLIEPVLNKQKSDRTIDVSHTAIDTLGTTSDGHGVDDYLVIKAQDFTTKVEIKALGVNTSNYSACVKLDKFSKLIGSIKSMPSFDYQSGTGGKDTGLKSYAPDGLVMSFDKRTIKLDNAILKRFDFGETCFLKRPECGAIQWNVSRLIEGLEYVSPAISSDETRFHLNGILLATSGDLVATDGHRMHCYSYHHFDDDAPAEFFKQEKDVIVAKQHVKMLQAAIKACGNDNANVSSHHGVVKSNLWMQFVVEGNGLCITINCKRIDSMFPRYKAVIPMGFGSRAVVDAQAFKESAKLLTKMSDNYQNLVEFRLNGQLHLKGGGVSESMDAPYTGEGFEFGERGANSSYLVDAANLPGESCTIEFGEKGLTPIKFSQAGGFLAVVMPIRC